MLRQLLSALLVSLVLALDNSTDDFFNTKNNVKPALNYNVRERRIQKKPSVEIKEHNVGRYFPRRPQSTTLSSIFSMKVENESQHVYPNMRLLKNLHVEPNQEKINGTDKSTSTEQQNYSPTANFYKRRPKNIHNKNFYTRTRRPSFSPSPVLVNHQTEEKIKQVVTSTTTATIVDIAAKGQENVMLPTSDSKFVNKVSSLKRPHPTISQIMKTFNQRMKEKVKKVDISISNTPVVVSSTEKEPEKDVFTPSDTYVSNLMLDKIHVQPKQEKINVTVINTSKQLQNIPSITNLIKNENYSINVRKTIRYTKPRRLSKAQKPALINQQTEKLTEQVVTSTKAAPIVDTTIKEQKKVSLHTSDSKVSTEVSSLEMPHLTISQKPEAFSQKIKETSEKVVSSGSNSSVLISTAENERRKSVFSPSAAYISNLISFVKSKRPTFDLRSVLPINQQKEANEHPIDSTAPTDVTTVPQEKIGLFPTTSYVPDKISTARPKFQQHHNRGSYKYNRKDLKKEESYVQEGVLDSNSSQVSSIKPSTPLPGPTL